MARELLDRMDHHAKTADEKVSVLFGATALLAAALAFNIGDEVGKLIGVGAPQPSAGAASILDLLGRASVFASVAVAVVCAILALVPRVRVHNVPPSIFFFGHVAGLNSDAFRADFTGLSTEEATQHFLSQAYVAAQIVTAKYTWTRRAGYAFALAIVFLILSQVIPLLARL